MTASAGPDRESAAYDVREHYTKYEFRVPMRDGVRLFTAVLVPKDASTTYPVHARPDAVRHGPVRAGRVRIAFAARREAFLKAGYILVRQDVRGRGHVGGRVHARDTASAGQADSRGRRREHRYLGHGRVAACARPQPQRPRRHLGHLVRRLLHGRRDHRHPSGDQGGIAAGARRRSVPRRRLVSRRGVHAGAKPSTRRRPTSRSPADAAAKVDVPFDYGT